MAVGALLGIGLALTGAQTAFTIAGNSKAAGAQKRQAIIAQAQAEKQAADAISLGGTAAARVFGEADRTIGRQQADIAGAGFEIGVGTAYDVTRATNVIASGDVAIIRENARRQALGFLTDARSAEDAARSSGAGLANFGALLGGASSVASQWYQYKRG